MWHLLFYRSMLLFLIDLPLRILIDSLWLINWLINDCNLSGNHSDALMSLQVLTRALLKRDCRSLTGRHSYILRHQSWGREWCHPQRQLPRRDSGTWMRKNPTCSSSPIHRLQIRVGRWEEISVASKGSLQKKFCQSSDFVLTGSTQYHCW